MSLRDVKLTIETESDGTCTFASNEIVSGFLLGIEWVVGSLVAGVDAVISVEMASGVDRTLLTLTNANANAFYNLRESEHDNAGAATTGTCYPVVSGKPSIAVTSGGDTKSGACILYYAPV